jgi:Ca2+/H+ antiporter, TMEM165/GDT1 family
VNLISQGIRRAKHEKNMRRWGKYARSMATTSDQPNPKPQRSSAQQVWLSTFLTIFLAEMGDKTQIATMLMSAQSGSPASVLIGSGLALIATSLIGVSIGRWLSRTIPPETLDTLAAILMLVIAILLIGEAIEG